MESVGILRWIQGDVSMIDLALGNTWSDQPEILAAIQRKTLFDSSQSRESGKNGYSTVAV